MRQAQNYEELKPFVEFCKKGRLFDVQAWIELGKPIDPPRLSKEDRKRKSPLHFAIELGFHSMVEVLLKAGANINDPVYCPLQHSLWKRRLDFVKLLVEHGANIHSVDMHTVFETWDPEIIEYFIDNGADLEKDYPLAAALCSKIRTALGIFMRHRDRYPSFRDQLNMALRHHCKEGNLKWVSLLLWAGADPNKKGPEYLGDFEEEEYSSALELAALYGHMDIFNLKSVKLDPNVQDAESLLRSACYKNKCHFLEILLDKGFDPKSLNDKGSSILQSLLGRMSDDFSLYTFTRSEKDIDSSDSREKMKMLHMLVRQGARWQPEDRSVTNRARRCLLKLKPDYTMEFVWIMSEYKACSYEDISELMKTPHIKAFVSKHLKRFNELMGALAN